MLKYNVRRAPGPFTQSVGGNGMDFTYPVAEGEYAVVLAVRATVQTSAAVVGRNIGVALQRGRSQADDETWYKLENGLNLVAGAGIFELFWSGDAASLSAGFQLSMAMPLPRVVFDRPFQVKFPSNLDAADVISGIEVTWVTGTLAEVLNLL